MFSTKEFIEASRSFVCVRIETYENKETEEMIRRLLNGRYVNTAFCIFDPHGKRRLTSTGRSPSQVIGRGGSEGNDSIIKEMEEVASRYRPRGKSSEAVLQDFLSFAQALLVASADQRLLVFVNAEASAIKKLSPTLKELFSDEEISGRFHIDFIGKEDENWGQVIEGSGSKSAINIIRAGKFGMDGVVISQLPLNSSVDKLKAELLAANGMFGLIETRKIYSKHVREGKRNGIKFESEIPYGEDRDGDGEIDERSSRSDGEAVTDRQGAGKSGMKRQGRRGRRGGQ